jgi:hypothetical protein
MISFVVKAVGLFGAVAVWLGITGMWAPAVWLGLAVSACVTVGGFVVGDQSLAITELGVLAVAVVGAVGLNLIDRVRENQKEWVLWPTLAIIAVVAVLTLVFT